LSREPPIIGREDGENEVVSGIAAEGLEIFWAVADEEGEDGVKELVE
jgi:hypothetical protein